MPPVINSLGGGDTHTQAHTRTDIHRQILRNQACTSGVNKLIF